MPNITCRSERNRYRKWYFYRGDGAWTGAGKILQVVKGAQMSETQLSSTSTTLADTGTTVTITPHQLVVNLNC